MNKICDCCDVEWEETFFCEKCSNKMELIETVEPKLDWQGWGDDFEEGEEEVSTGNVCMNCCDCHLR